MTFDFFGLYFDIIMVTITIPKKISINENLVAIPRKEYELLRSVFEILKERKEKKEITENDILRWSREAKKLKKTGRLLVLRSLKDFR